MHRAEILRRAKNQIKNQILEADNKIIRKAWCDLFSVYHYDVFNEDLTHAGWNPLEHAGKDPISFSNKGIDDVDVKYLSAALNELHNSHRVYSITLNNNKITDVNSIGEVLKRDELISRLLLNNNKITDNGIQSFIDALKTNNTLRLLDLRNNQLSDNMKLKLKDIEYHKKNGTEGWKQVAEMTILVNDDKSNDYTLPVGKLTPDGKFTGLKKNLKF